MKNGDAIIQTYKVGTLGRSVIHSQREGTFIRNEVPKRGRDRTPRYCWCWIKDAPDMVRVKISQLTIKKYRPDI